MREGKGCILPFLLLYAFPLSRVCLYVTQSIGYQHRHAMAKYRSEQALATQRHVPEELFLLLCNAYYGCQLEEIALGGAAWLPHFVYGPEGKGCECGIGQLAGCFRNHMQ